MSSPTKVLTAEDLVDVLRPDAVKVSPTGKQVIYTVSPVTVKDKHAVSAIWIADIGKENSARQLTSGIYNDSGPQWSPDGEHIAFVSDRAEHGESSAVYLLSTKGGEAFPITKADNKRTIVNFQWSPNGKHIAYLSVDEKSADKKKRDEDRDDAIVWGEELEFNRLRTVHVATRDVTTLFSKDKHVNSFVWSQDSGSIVYVLHHTPDINSPADGVKIERLSLTEKKANKSFDFPGIASGLAVQGDRIFFMGGVRQSKSNTSQAIYKISLDQEDASWENYKYGVKNDVEDVVVDGKSVWVHVTEGLSSQIDLLDGQKTIYKGVHQIESWHVATSDQGSVLAFSKSSVDKPTEVYSWVDGSLVQLSQYGTAIAALKIGTDKPFKCTAKDGTDLDGVFILPRNRSEDGTMPDGSPWPTFVQVHGGPYYRSTISFNPSTCHWAPWIVSAGYAVLCPNYRGGSGRGDEFARAAEGGMGTSDYDDIISMVKAGIEKGLIDERRVIIGGWSQGGFLSYLAVTRPDFQFKGAICGAGVTDWDMMSMTSDVPSFESELAGKAPWEEGAIKVQNRHGSPIWHMKDINTPILILHGEKDVRVPTTQAIAFHRGCKHLNIPCDMVIYPREGHPIKERLHRLDMLKRVRQFAELHLN